MDSQLELLKKIPKEHWTEHLGKPILVKDLFELLNEKNINNGSSRNRKDHAFKTLGANDRRGSSKRRRNQKRDS